MYGLREEYIWGGGTLVGEGVVPPPHAGTRGGGPRPQSGSLPLPKAFGLIEGPLSAFPVNCMEKRPFPRRDGLRVQGDEERISSQFITA